MLHLSNYQLRMELDNLKRDLEYNYGQCGVMRFNGFYDQFHVELYNWKLARCNALETYVNAQFMVSRMEQQAQYAANVKPRWRSKPKRKQVMPPNNKFNYNNKNLHYVSNHPKNNNNVSNHPNYNNVSNHPKNNNVSNHPNNNNVSNHPNNNNNVSNHPNNNNNNVSKHPNNVSKPSINNNVTRPSNKAITTNNVSLPRADPETPPRIDNVQIKQEPFDGDEAFITNIKQEKLDDGYEHVTKWVDDVNLNLNIKQEKVDPSYEVGQKRKCSSKNNCNSKKAKFHS